MIECVSVTHEFILVFVIFFVSLLLLFVVSIVVFLFVLFAVPFVDLSYCFLMWWDSSAKSCPSTVIQG